MAPMLSLEETAERLRISVNTVRYLRQQKRFAPAIKIGRLLFWDEADVEAWKQRQKEPA